MESLWIFFSNLTRVFARLLICLILILLFFLFEFFALNRLVISADLFSYLCFEVRLICMYMCFLFGCMYTIRVSYCLIANFNGGCVFCYVARVHFGIRVRVRDSAIFEKGGCRCGGTRRLKNY